MSEYKSKDIQRLFDKSSETVRAWSERFSKYLSPNATPGQGKHRLFTHEDIEIFAFIAEEKSRGRTYEEIDASLHNGAKGNVPEALAERSLVLENTLQLEVASRQLAVIQAEKDEALAKVQALHDEKIRLEVRLEEAASRQKMVEDQAQKQTEEVEKIRAEMRELLLEVGSLRAKLEMLQKKEG